LAALIGVDDILCDSGPLGDDKASCGDDKDNLINFS